MHKACITDGSWATLLHLGAMSWISVQSKMRSATFCVGMTGHVQQQQEAARGREFSNIAL